MFLVEPHGYVVRRAGGSCAGRVYVVDLHIAPVDVSLAYVAIYVVDSHVVYVTFIDYLVICC